MPGIELETAEYKTNPLRPALSLWSSWNIDLNIKYLLKKIRKGALEKKGF